MTEKTITACPLPEPMPDAIWWFLEGLANCRADVRETVADLLFRQLATHVVARRPNGDFNIGPDPDNPYMRRWFVIPRNDDFNIYLHHIRHSDDDRALHDHPWQSLSLCLAGGMYEITGSNDPDHPDHARAVVKAGDVRSRDPLTAHRLELAEPPNAPVECWTLFITGPKVRTWGFHCPQGFVPWDEFTDPDNPGAPGRGCGEVG